jgi:hypothetical protein
MKFLDWVKSVDHLVIPISVDLGLSVFAAGLATALIRYVIELAV